MHLEVSCWKLEVPLLSKLAFKRKVVGLLNGRSPVTRTKFEVPLLSKLFNNGGSCFNASSCDEAYLAYWKQNKNWSWNGLNAHIMLIMQFFCDQLVVRSPVIKERISCNVGVCPIDLVIWVLSSLLLFFSMIRCDYWNK